MCDKKKLLDLIEKNEAAEILAQENIVERLNVLFKYEIIYYNNGKIIISEKGENFRKSNDYAPFFKPAIQDFSLSDEE